MEEPLLFDGVIEAIPNVIQTVQRVDIDRKEPYKQVLNVQIVRKFLQPVCL